jgi:tRNA dimethylallyltransferase
LDIADPTEDVGAGEFVERALRAMDEIVSRGKVPIVVGGTGMYLRWLIEGKPNAPPSDPAQAARAKEVLRRVASEARARIKKGIGEQVFLSGKTSSQARAEYRADDDAAAAAAAAAAADATVRAAADAEAWRAAMLFLKRAGDPTADTRLAANDWYRAERALAVLMSTGKPVVDFTTRKKPDYDFTCVVLSSPRVALYRRVDARVEEMVRDGILRESCDMLLSGIEPGSTSASRAIGYRQALDFLCARAAADANERADHDSFIEYVEETQKATRAFAKRQFTWFRGERAGLYSWLDVSLCSAENEETLSAVVLGLFRGQDGETAARRDVGDGKPKENRAALSSVLDPLRGETDHETARELKRYRPAQTIFVDAQASRQTRSEVDSLAEKIRAFRRSEARRAGMEK